MATDPRPLSPHLQIYKLPFTALLSITHRVTGLFLTFGTLAIAWYFIAAATSAEAFATASGVLGSIPGLIVLFGWTLALYFHMGNGIRHLIWDPGHGLDMDSVKTSAMVMLAIAAVLTIATWLVALI